MCQLKRVTCRLSCRFKRRCYCEQVNDAFRNAGLDGILDVEDEPLVSMDFNTNPNSVIDAQNTIVMDDNKVKVIAWYDNEWGYSNRVVEVAQQIAKLIGSENVATAK